MSDEEVKAWMRDNKSVYEDAASLAEGYCNDNDALDDDGEVPDEINTIASEVWEEGSDSDDDSDGADDSDADSEDEE